MNEFHNNLPGARVEPREILGQGNRLPRFYHPLRATPSRIHRIQTERCRPTPLHRSVLRVRSVLRGATDPAPLMLPWCFYAALMVGAAGVLTYTQLH